MTQQVGDLGHRELHRRARAADTEVASWFFEARSFDDDLVGWGYGAKVRGGEETDEDCLAVFVQAKWSRGFIAQAARVPERIGGFPTDVVPVGSPSLLGGRGKAESRVLSGPDAPSATSRVARPVFWGARISHAEGPQGTLGCTFTSRQKLYLLSNCHVLAPDEGAKKGDAIVQPPGSLLVARDRIGKLARWVDVVTTETTPLEEQDNLVDAAVASVRKPDATNPAGYVANGFAPEEGLVLTSWRATEDIGRGLPVTKVGGMTGRTHGKVKYVAASLVVPFGLGEAMFRNQLLMSDMGEPGDSGSLVLAADGSAVGLVFAQAGLDAGYGTSLTIVNPIESVQSLLRIEVAPSRWGS